MVKRPKQRKVLQPTDDELTELSECATYVGSEEHKEVRWWNGNPRGRQLSGARVGRPGKQTTTICPLTCVEDRDKATSWVRAAIVAGQYRFYESDKKLPRKLWYEAEGQVWMGLSINSVLGQYKGWPIDRRERDEIFGRMD